MIKLNSYKSLLYLFLSVVLLVFSLNFYHKIFQKDALAWYQKSKEEYKSKFVNQNPPKKEFEIKDSLKEKISKQRRLLKRNLDSKSIFTGDSEIINTESLEYIKEKLKDQQNVLTTFQELSKEIDIANELNIISQPEYYGCITDNFSLNYCYLNFGLPLTSLFEGLAYYHLYVDKDYEKMKETIQKMFRIVMHYLNMRTSLIEYMVSLNIEKLFLKTLYITKDKLPEEMRRGMIHELEKYNSNHFYPAMNHEFVSMTYSMQSLLKKTVREYGYSSMFRPYAMGGDEKDKVKPNAITTKFFKFIFEDLGLLYLLIDFNQMIKHAYDDFLFYKSYEKAKNSGGELPEKPHLSFRFYNIIYNPIGAIISSTAIPSFNRYIDKFYETKDIRKKYITLLN